MTKEMSSYTSVGDFETSVAVTEWLGASGGANLVNVTADAMDTVVFDAIQAEIAALDGDAAVNVTIKQEATALDMILNYVTGNIYSPVHVVITGTVVKY
jgi:hypothetical protein